MNASERLEQYIKAALADKEREKWHLEGEVATLQFMLTTLQQFIAQEKTNA